MRHSRQRGPRAFLPPPPPAVHQADANDTQIEPNEGFLHDVEFAFGPDTELQPDLAAEQFINFLDHGRTQPRPGVPGPMLENRDLDFSLYDFLTRLPIQKWPLPHANTCPCSFCDDFVPPRSIDAHLEFIHAEFFRRSLDHTEVQLRMADLLGIHLTATRTQKWCCPFLHCTAGRQTFSDISDHIYTRMMTKSVTRP
jgi:hypothetical protein